MFKGNPLDIYYTAYGHDVGYMFKFWNETADTEFTATYEF